MMKNGPSLYYASDKNIFDALNQSKVDQETIQNLFQRRNIASSRRTSREELAKFFSRLTHDAIDHQDLSRRLGITRRQERVTALDLRGTVPPDSIDRAIEKVRADIIAEGNNVQISKSGKSITISIRYTEIDYKRSEFSQVQTREGYIEIFREQGELLVRNTQAEYINGIRGILVHGIEQDAGLNFEKAEVSLYHYPDHKIRSKFFYDLVMDLPNFVRKDVTDVFVFKSKPKRYIDVESEAEDTDPHIERVLLRGQGVSQSELLRQLTQEKSYYIVKIGWLAVEKLGRGFGFDVEAMFADPENCTGFSYILRGVHEIDDQQKLLKNRRSPTTSEIDFIAKAIEDKARNLMRDLKSQPK